MFGEISRELEAPLDTRPAEGREEVGDIGEDLVPTQGPDPLLAGAVDESDADPAGPLRREHSDHVEPRCDPMAALVLPVPDDVAVPLLLEARDLPPAQIHDEPVDEAGDIEEADPPPQP